MNIFLGILVMILALVALYFLGYAVAWAVDHTLVPLALWIWRKHREWDSAYRD